MRELVLLAGLLCALQLVTSAALGGSEGDDTTHSHDPWLEANPELDTGESDDYQLQWMGTPPSPGSYRWHDDIMRRSRKSAGGRYYTAGELVELLRRLAASRKLRQVRVANKAIRFGISKRSLRQRF